LQFAVNWSVMDWNGKIVASERTWECEMSYMHLIFAILLALITLGLIRCWRSQRTDKPYLLAWAVTCLALLSWPPIAWLSSQLLERSYSPVFAGGDAQAIVVLSGNVLPSTAGRPAPVPDRDTSERCTYAGWLHNHWKPLPVLASGRNSATMRLVLEGVHVPAAMIWTEERSESTYESALLSAELLRAKGITRIALVTEAYHMLRSEKAFRKQGMTVIPAPCAFNEFTLKPSEFIPGTSPLRRQELVLHEGLGLLWYWINGRI
jgi:uncharacterized SAM-binding protein YcdF (DUF218 family)